MIVNQVLPNSLLQTYLTNGGRIVTRRAAIAQPQVTQPVNGSVNLPVVGSTTLAATPFEGEGLTQTGAMFEVRTGPNGSGVMAFSGDATAIPPLTLSLSTTYYVRMRYMAGEVVSDWSADSVISTAIL